MWIQPGYTTKHAVNQISLRKKKNDQVTKQFFSATFSPGRKTVGCYSNERIFRNRGFYTSLARYATLLPVRSSPEDGPRAGRPCFGTINANWNAPRVVTVCQVVHSAVLKTQRDSGGLFLTLRVLRGCDAPLRKPPWPTCVKAYGNVRAMIKAPTVFTAITAVKVVVNETPSGAAVYVTVIR